MAFRLSRTLFAQVARPAMRASTRNAGRRMMSTEAHGASKGSDMPWIIGSAVVFGPMAFYLLTPSSKDKAHKAVEHASPKEKEPEAAPVPKSEPLPAVDDEGTKVPVNEVTESAQGALNADSPVDAQAAEEGKGTAPSEAAENAPKEEGKESAPKEGDEETAPKEETPAPDIEQKEKPSTRAPPPVDQSSDARQESTSGKDPKKSQVQEERNLSVKP